MNTAPRIINYWTTSYWMALTGRLRERPLLVAVLGLLALLLFRNSLLFGPNIFGDELTYSALARASGKVSEIDVNLVSPLPNHLYFDLYNWTSHLGPASISAARALNAIFCALAIIPLYSLVRRWLTPHRAALTATAVAFICPGLYSGLQLPEAMYAFFFYCCMTQSVALMERRWQSIPAAIVLALLLAALILTKPHGLVVAVVLCASPFLVWTRGQVSLNLLRSVLGLGTLLLAFAIRQIYVAYSGDAVGLNQSMGAYQALLTALPHFIESSQALPAIRLALFQNFAASIPWLVPAAAAAFATVGPRNAEGQIDLPRVAMLCIATWLAVMMMTSVFTAFVAVVAGESPDRIHQRYYDYSLAMLLVVFVSSWKSFGGRGRLTLLLATFVSLGFVISFLRLFPIAANSWLDHPILFGAYHFPIVGKWSLLLPLLIGLFAAYRPKLRDACSAAFLILASWWSASAILTQARESRLMMAPDKLGLALSMLQDGEERPTIIAAPGNDSPHRIAFFLAGGGTYHVIPLTDTVTLDNILAKSSVAAIVYADARFKLNSGWVPIQEMPGNYTEYERRSNVQASLHNNLTLQEISLAAPRGVTLTGFHPAESWGAWMSSKTATIGLPKPMLGSYLVRLNGRTLDTSNSKAVLKVCGREFPLNFQNVVSNVAVKVECDEAAEDLSLSVPRTTTPKSLGINEDERPLGLALQDVSIKKL